MHNHIGYVCLSSGELNRLCKHLYCDDCFAPCRLLPRMAHVLQVGQAAVCRGNEHWQWQRCLHPYAMGKDSPIHVTAACSSMHPSSCACMLAYRRLDIHTFGRGYKNNRANLLLLRQYHMLCACCHTAGLSKSIPARLQIEGPFCDEPRPRT